MLFIQKVSFWLRGPLERLPTVAGIAKLPVESSEVQLQCVFMRLCGSSGSQVLPVKILPVVWQPLIILYIWADATHSPWHKGRHSSHFTEKPDKEIPVSYSVDYRQWTPLLQRLSSKDLLLLPMTFCHTFGILMSHCKKYSSRSAVYLQFNIKEKAATSCWATKSTRLGKNRGLIYKYGHTLLG